jgi:hypothetical protein
MKPRARTWITVATSGLAACAPQAHVVDDDAAASPPDAGREGSWQRCCAGDHGGIPGGRTRGSGDSLECFCPATIACNYALGSCFTRDAGLDVGTIDDAGFTDAGSMDAGATDALVTDDSATP